MLRTRTKIWHVTLKQKLHFMVRHIATFQMQCLKARNDRITAFLICITVKPVFKV